MPDDKEQVQLSLIDHLSGLVEVLMKQVQLPAVFLLASGVALVYHGQAELGKGLVMTALGLFNPSGVKPS